MGRDRPPLDLSCPACGSRLEPLGGSTDGVVRLRCPGCGESFRARRREKSGRSPGPTAPRPSEGFGLAGRALALWLVPPAYRAGVVVGTASLVALGGFVPLIRGWLADRVEGWSGVVEAAGGAWVSSESRDPDNDLGPLLRRVDAPNLFEEIGEVARRLGVRPPDEVRLAFLPCCGVVAWRRSRALLLGLPLLHVLTIAELRAVLAHELAHLAGGDATRSARALRFVEGLGRALDDPSSRSWGPLRAWARFWRWSASGLVGPIARGQEARADRTSAAVAGGGAAASALIKVALVQPLFRELLAGHDPNRDGSANLYATFREFWARLPEPLVEAMRLRLLSVAPGPVESTHPPLPDRIATVQGYPDRSDGPSDPLPAIAMIGDPEWLERMLHDRLYGLMAIEPTVFHKAGT